MDALAATSSLSEETYLSLLSHGTLIHELSAKTADGTAFLHGIEIYHPKLEDNTQKSLKFIENALKPLESALKSPKCCQKTREFYTQIHQIKAQILDSQAQNRRASIKKIFSPRDLEFAKELPVGKIIPLTNFPYLKLTTKALKLVSPSKSYNLPSMTLQTNREYRIFLGKVASTERFNLKNT